MRDDQPAAVGFPAGQSLFVILTLQRTGSTMLARALNSHAAIRCHGELMRKRSWSRSKGKSRRTGSRWQREHPMEYLEATFAQHPANRFQGFKLMLGQHPVLRDTLIADSRFRKVLLYRENELAAYSSREIQRMNHSGSELLPEFIPADFEEFRARREKHYAHARQALAVGQTWLETEYLEACTDEGRQRIAAFIGADPSCPMNVRTEKRNAHVIVERFANRGTVLAYLRANGLERWATEEYLQGKVSS